VKRLTDDPSYPILFLDIDGVLNYHTFDPSSQSNAIDRESIERLNRILETTKARIVLSSAWRYMIHKHALTLKGFHFLLRTHGMVATVDGSDEVIIDITCRDEDIPTRAGQIQAWLDTHQPERYAILDDMDLGFTEANMNWIEVLGEGLTDRDVREAVALLSRPQSQDTQS
jgi:hypothetical protein